jgi:hypothetical protein
MLDSFGKTPDVLEVRHEAGLASKTEMQTTPKPGTLMLTFVLYLMLAGFVLTLYQVASFFGPILFPVS